MEGISNARRFMSALRAAANAKPVVVLKAGRKTAGNKAAQTHSAPLWAATMCSMPPAPRGCGAGALVRGAVLGRQVPGLALPAGGQAPGHRHQRRRPGRAGGRLGQRDFAAAGPAVARSAEALKAVLPALASLTDLIDLSEDASPEHYRLALEAASKESRSTACWSSIRPRPVAMPRQWPPRWPRFQGPHEQAAAGLLDGRCLGGEARTHPARGVMIPSFRTPEAAVGAFGNIASFYQNQQLLQQTPPPLSTLAKPDMEGARLLIESVLAERRKVLTEMESKALLAAFHIPVTKTILARNANEAMMIATQLGFPVALKIDSPDISHKSDVQRRGAQRHEAVPCATPTTTWCSGARAAARMRASTA
jgi:acetyltransferase